MYTHVCFPHQNSRLVCGRGRRCNILEAEVKLKKRNNNTMRSRKDRYCSRSFMHFIPFHSMLATAKNVCKYAPSTFQLEKTARIKTYKSDRRLENGSQFLFRISFFQFPQRRPQPKNASHAEGERSDRQSVLSFPHSSHPSIIPNTRNPLAHASKSH